MSSYPEVVITDETLRDGFQIEDVAITVEQKIRLIDAIADAGVKRIVVGSFVSPKWTPQMADIEEVVTALKPKPGISYLAVALNQRGHDRIAAYSPPLTVESMIPQTHQHMCASFSVRNTNATPEKYEASYPVIINKARENGVSEAGIGISSAWGSNFSGDVSKDDRFAVLQKQWDLWNEAGIRVVSIVLADPMGWNSPHKLADDIQSIREKWPDIRNFHIHMHNARGLAIASAYACLDALDAGHTLYLETALGGIGGCPNCGTGRATGMIPTEDLVAMLEEMGIDTGVDQYKLVEASVILQEILGRTLDSKVPKAGPFPRGEHLFPMEVPIIETHQEALHWRLGPSVYEGQRSPWLDATKK